MIYLMEQTGNPAKIAFSAEGKLDIEKLEMMREDSGTSEGITITAHEIPPDIARYVHTMEEFEDEYRKMLVRNHFYIIGTRPGKIGCAATKAVWTKDASVELEVIVENVSISDIEIKLVWDLDKYKPVMYARDLKEFMSILADL